MILEVYLKVGVMITDFGEQVYLASLLVAIYKTTTFIILSFIYNFNDLNLSSNN